MRILYVTTISSTIRFFIEHVKMLIRRGHVVDFACRVTREIPYELVSLGCRVYDLDFSRSPTSLSNYKAYRQLKKILDEESYDIVHTHTPIASAIVRLCCRKRKDIRVVYTAHGFHFYKGGPWINWLIYYPIEYFLARYTDILIVINSEDYERARHYLRAGRVEYVPGVGIDVEKHSSARVSGIDKRAELGLDDESFVIVSVGELNHNKNHRAVLYAIHALEDSEIKYLICGKGPLQKELQKLIIELDLEDQVFLLGHRNDIIEINKSADVFVFPSFREGLSVALMEAMACGLPVVCSNIRGNRDLIDEGLGGFLVEPTDSNGIAKAIKILMEEGSLRERMGRYNAEKIQAHDISVILQKLESIYENIS